MLAIVAQPTDGVVKRRLAWKSLAGSVFNSVKVFNPVKMLCEPIRKPAPPALGVLVTEPAGNQAI
jgi:hypothetical protein